MDELDVKLAREMALKYGHLKWKELSEAERSYYPSSYAYEVEYTDDGKIIRRKIVTRKSIEGDWIDDSKFTFKDVSPSDVIKPPTDKCFACVHTTIAHKCPYQMDINDDHNYRCNCCDNCTKECGMDI